MSHKYYEEWVAAARAVKVEGPMPVTFSIRLERGGMKLVGHMWTTDVDTGKKTTINAREDIIYDEPPHPQFFYSVAQHLFLHELEESIKINDAYMYEPHKLTPRKNRKVVKTAPTTEWWNA